MPSFELDGKTVEFELGEKILSAAMRAKNSDPIIVIILECLSWPHGMCMVDVIDMGNGRPAKLQTNFRWMPSKG